MADMGLAFVDMEALSTMGNLDMDEALEDSNSLATFDGFAFIVKTAAIDFLMNFKYH